GDVSCANSWEAESHLQLFGVGQHMACWTMAGYASGYVTRFFKRLIVFRETHCTCCGDPVCTMVGKPAEAWGDDVDLDYCQVDPQTPFEDLQQNLWQLRSRQVELRAPGNLVGSSPAFSRAFELLSKA